MLASAVHWAEVGVSGYTVLVGASDLWHDMASIGKAVESEDTDAVGVGLGKMLTDWRTLIGECHSTQCMFLDGFLKLAQAVAKDAAPCEAALVTPLKSLMNGTELFRAKEYEASVKEFAAGLDGVSLAIGKDSCGLTTLSKVISQVVPRLRSAIVNVESSKTVSILVGSAEIYDELYRATKAIANGDAAEFGQEIGFLLNKLKSSGCETKACIVLDGVMAALQLEAQDFTACAADLDAAWKSIPDAVDEFETGSMNGVYKGLNKVGDFLVDAAESVGNCGIPDLGNILEGTASKLFKNTSVTEIGDIVSALVSGSDVTFDVQKVSQDLQRDPNPNPNPNPNPKPNPKGDTRCQIGTVALSRP